MKVTIYFAVGISFEAVTVIFKVSLLRYLILLGFLLVRCAVVGCYVTEDEFLEKEGVFLLVDILEVQFSFAAL